LKQHRKARRSFPHLAQTPVARDTNTEDTAESVCEQEVSQNVNNKLSDK